MHVKLYKRYCLKLLISSKIFFRTYSVVSVQSDRKSSCSVPRLAARLVLMKSSLFFGESLVSRTMTGITDL